jgi:chemotaxis signal transduction protein
VVDLAALLGEGAGVCSRLVTVKAGDRLVALAVDEAVGLRSLPDASLPPLMQQAASDTVIAMSTLDSELLLVLDAARLAPGDWFEHAFAAPSVDEGR